jgi:hypothetical protein
MEIIKLEAATEMKQNAYPAPAYDSCAVNHTLLSIGPHSENICINTCLREQQVIDVYPGRGSIFENPSAVKIHAAFL